MQDDDDIDYRHLLAASSEEDLVLFEKDLWTGGQPTSSSEKAHIRRKHSESQNQTVSKWSDRFVSNVKSLFQNHREKNQHQELIQPPSLDSEAFEGVQNDRGQSLDTSSAETVNGQEGINKQRTIWSNAQAGIERLLSSSKYKSRAHTGSAFTTTNNDDSALCTGGNSSDNIALHNYLDQSLTSNGESWPSPNSDRGRFIGSPDSETIGSEVADDTMSGKYNYSSEIGESEEDPLFGGHRKSSDVYYKGQQISWKRRILISMLVILILCAAIGCGVALGVIYGRDEEPNVDDVFIYQNAAVAADAAACSEVGSAILSKEGSAIDAAIAGLLCVGLYNAHSAGIGGGSFIMYYDRETETPSFLNSREVAPLGASTDMFENVSSTTGGLAIAVPGEIMGYWDAHERFGKLPWADLFQPSIELAENGFTVGPALARAIDQNSEIAMSDPSLREIMVDENGNLLKENSTMYRRKLGQTMRAIADGGADVFYRGSLAATIAAEIQEAGGIVNVTDLDIYRVADKAPLSIEVGGYRTYACPPPCSGPVYSLILNILDGYGFNPESLQSVSDETLTYHRIIEAFKFAYAKRSALGDADFVDVEELVANMTSQDYADYLRSRITDNQTHDTEYYEPSFQIVQDGGTSHISVVDQFGNAASITSTINTYFGSKVRGFNTGIIYNNEMDDFSKPGAPNAYGVPPSPSNFIVPGKRPLSSMTPVIMIDDEGDVKLVVGASGGTRITTATSLVTMETLWFGSSLEDGVERRRVHHQLLPNATMYEPGFSQEVVAGLQRKGQETQESSSIAVVQVINRLEDDWLEAYCDSRKDGRPAGF